MQKTVPDVPDIRIYISCHKDCCVPEWPPFHPVQVGTALAKERLDMLHDDEGDNISEKNGSYCELTAQYWAWKNQQADYYGFFHYRRYLSFSEKKFPADPFGEVHEPCNDRAALKKYGILPERLYDIIPRYDLIVPQEGGFKEGMSLYRQYCVAPVHHKEDLDFVLGVIKHDHPDMYPYAVRYLRRKKGYFCNMFIMKRELFCKYCEWLFPILEKHERSVDISAYSEQAYRVHGFLAERLCGIFIYWLEKTQKLRILKLQRVLFADTEKEETLLPAYGENAVAAVFSANDHYVPYLSALLMSVKEHASAERNYDLLVLHRDIKEENRRRLKADTEAPNISLRFLNVTRPMSRYENLPLRGHFKAETYFRLLLPELLLGYKKILYLDSDMIACTDIAPLYETDVTGYLLAACRDADTAGLYNGYEPNKKDYTDNILKLKNPYDYFQAGTILFNLEEFRKTYTVPEMMEYAMSYQWELLDQDVLNHLAEGKTLFADMAWNVMTDWKHIRIRDIIGRAPRPLYREYMAARKAPKIIHYAGPDKPWSDPESDFAELFWQYSRKTSYYEAVLGRLASVGKKEKKPGLFTALVLRPLANIFFPVGTARREKLKKLLKHTPS